MRPAFVFDLETCLMQKGFKRGETIILSIAAIDLYSDRHFNVFVKPLPGICTTEALKEALEGHGARLDASLCVLSKINYDINRALPLKAALEMLKVFCSYDSEACPVLLAHNGRSFDFKILLGSLSREKVEFEFKGLDTYLDVGKKAFRLQSYNLRNMYKAVVPRKEQQPIKWHNALDDCVALKAVVFACCKRLASRNIQSYFNASYETINKVFKISLKQETLTTSEEYVVKKALEDLSTSALTLPLQNILLSTMINDFL